MKKGFRFIQSTTGVSPYIWAFFAILPFYFIFQWSTTIEIVIRNDYYPSFSLLRIALRLLQKDWLDMFGRVLSS